MPKAVIEAIGKRYGHLVVKQRAEAKGKHGVLWLCDCDCGNTVVVRGTSLRLGATRSCGCRMNVKTVRVGDTTANLGESGEYLVASDAMSRGFLVAKILNRNGQHDLLIYVDQDWRTVQSKVPRMLLEGTHMPSAWGVPTGSITSDILALINPEHNTVRYISITDGLVLPSALTEEKEKLSLWRNRDGETQDSISYSEPSESYTTRNSKTTEARKILSPTFVPQQPSASQLGLAAW